MDYTNSVTVAGTTVPGTSIRRVQTEVELESGQTFVIAGLLDSQTTENLSKIPGISAIPLLGKLFQSRSITRNHSELLVIITPEIVRPIPVDMAVPQVPFPSPFLPPLGPERPRQPGMGKTGPVPVHPTVESIPVEQLMLPPKSTAPAGVSPGMAAPPCGRAYSRQSGLGLPVSPGVSGGGADGAENSGGKFGRWQWQSKYWSWLSFRLLLGRTRHVAGSITIRTGCSISPRIFLLREHHQSQPSRFCLGRHT